MATRLNETYERLYETESPWPQRVISRLTYWPTLALEGNRFFAVEGSFTIPGMVESGDGPNFWVLSKQYYALSWSLFALAYSESSDLPYKSNVSSRDDAEHRSELQGIIRDVGFGREAMLDLAHLSCETAFKSLLLHTLPDLGQRPGFPKTHDLEKLVVELGPNNASLLESWFQEWPERVESLTLTGIVHGSGSRFVQQRYGEIYDAPIQYGVMALSKFVHSECTADGT